MKAITLWEPWASLMSIGAKNNETRGVRTSHRGDICIHAALKADGTPEELIPAIIQAFKSRNAQPDPNSLGCILAVVDLWDVQPDWKFSTSGALAVNHIVISKEEYIFGNYGPNRWVFRTRNLRRLKHPVHCRGSQAIGWTVPPEFEKLVLEQIQ